MANNYRTHGFISGMKLTGTAMAEVDAQIKANADNIDTLTGRMDAVMYERQEEIRSLTLTTDGQSVMLYYHNELLGEITLPGDLDSIIRCTALSVSSNDIEVFVGETPVTITATRQPADCNQHLKFMSSDVRKAVVTSQGAVSGLEVGEIPITVRCGTFSQTVTANVKKRISLDGYSSLVTWLMTATEGYTPKGHAGVNNTSVQFQYGGDLPYLANAPFDPARYVIHPGEKATLTVQSPLSIRRMFVVKAEYEDVIPAPVDMIEDNDNYFFTPITVVEQIGGSSSTLTMEYNNYLDEDVWIAFFCNGGSETVLESVDDYVSLVISTADPQGGGSGGE